MPSAHGYGRSTRDPRGKDGPGWELDDKTRLPRWVGDGPPTLRPRCQRYDEGPCPDPCPSVDHRSS